MLSRTIRLLVVEDSPSYLYLVTNAFSDRGEKIRWELTVAKDGEDQRAVAHADGGDQLGARIHMAQHGLDGCARAHRGQLSKLHQLGRRGHGRLAKDEQPVVQCEYQAAAGAEVERRYDDAVKALRSSQATGRPLGTVDFVDDLERRLGRPLAPRTRGRKAQADAADQQSLL